MPIRFLVIGCSKRNLVVERWFLRSSYLVDMARADMRQDPRIKRITVVALCGRCGEIQVQGCCTNEACVSRRPALAAPVAV